MKLINKNANPLAHGTYRLLKGQVVDVPEEVAKVWLKVQGIEKYVEPEDFEKTQAEAKKVQEALQKENEELKKQIEELKAKQPEKTQAEAKKTTKK